MRRKIKKHLSPKSNAGMFFVGAGFLIVGLIIIWISSVKIPDFHSFDDRKVVSSTKIYDRTGQILLYDIHHDVKRTNIAFDAMGANIKNATVAIEDAEFYNHSGIRITSIIRAVLSNILGLGKVQGGSTITQQLVKNTLLTSQRTIGRKFKEWILAIKIDRAFGKNKILELYLNEAPYGGNVYGVEEASKTYFGKDAQGLTLAEAAYLAAIPNSPTTLSPNGKNKSKLDDRKNLVLAKMLENKFITQEEYDKAKAEVVNFLPQSTGGIKAPHFVFFIKDYLEQKYGVDLVENGGLKVTTTLDYNLEQRAEDIVKTGALDNEKNYNSSNAALVAIDPKTGQILSMVGSRDYFDKNIEGNFNVATASRQPGSSFKPFIYATAFNKGFTPDTVLFDLPTEFQTTCNAYGKALPGYDQKDCYMPDDFDNKFRGPMKLRDALAQSINIPAIKLLYLVGLPDALKTAQNMGISTLTDPSRYGLTLVIGGGEVTLLDITSSYGVFANSGVRNPYTGILKIEDETGKTLEEFAPAPSEVLPKNTALTVSDILSDSKARIPTFGQTSVLDIAGRSVAAKTGTTNNYKDGWTIGYTPSIVVGVWAGNNNNTSTKKGGGSVLAGPIWNKFMTEALKIMPNEKFEKPNLETDPEKIKPVLRGLWEGNEHFFIDKISGKLATTFTPKETKEEKVITNVHSILYWVSKKNIIGHPPANPNNDPQFEHWEIPLQDWWVKNSYKYNVTTWGEMPSSSDDVHTASSKPALRIITPNTTTEYSQNEKIKLETESFGLLPIQKMDIFINDIYIGPTKNPFNFSFTPSEIENLKEQNTLKIIFYDSAYNSSEISTYFKVK